MQSHYGTWMPVREGATIPLAWAHTGRRENYDGRQNRPTTDTHRSVWSDTGMAIGALRYVTLESGCILCDYNETQDAADMKKIILLAFLVVMHTSL